MPEFTVNLASVSTWFQFTDAFNAGFSQQFGIVWNGDLGAFNDLLCWPKTHPYRLTFLGWRACRENLVRHLTPDQRPIMDVAEELLRRHWFVQLVLR